MIKFNSSPAQNKFPRLVSAWLPFFIWSGTCLLAQRADAYVGPGAGFVLVSGFWTLAALVLAALAILVLPVRLLLSWRRGKKIAAQASAERVVVIGLDGLDPQLVARWMEEGRLPEFKRLAEQGTFCPLQTTLPAITPAAWSAFATGVDASRHRIYDFITRDPQTYQPVLSSARINAPRRSLGIGPYRLPLGKAQVRNLRRSQPFWKVLGDNHVSSCIVRVPISFPPEKFSGLLLAGMCAPDLRGTQGECTYFFSGPGPQDTSVGRCIRLELECGRVSTSIPGPANPLRPDGKRLTAAMDLVVDPAAESATLVVGGEKIVLQKRVYSPWITLAFVAGPGVRVRGLCRFYLIEAEPLRLYVTPIQIDPTHPHLPLSHPPSYAPYLARRLGKFATVGLAEDTDALNADLIDEQAFLDQTYLLDDERQAMFFHALDKTPKGLTACVFDSPDRIQHMFFRTLDPDHPANQGREVNGLANTIPDMYARMDDLVGRTLEKIDCAETVLMVISDHGFCTFKRGVNLNTWLWQNGYLCLHEGCTHSDEWLAQVDWSRTRAFALGLTGLFINLRGREVSGIVAPGTELRQLKAELCSRLTGLVDQETGETAINKAWDTAASFSGPYTDDGPDLLIGYNAGYRASWSGASGQVTEAVFETNTRPWSGDHCVDPRLVPGVFFCNRKIDIRNPHLLDIPPSILGLFGIEPPSYMQGRDVFAPAAESNA